MGTIIVTPNMNLPNPVPGVDPGIDYADNLYNSLNILDQHNHTPGQGVQIPSAGLNINTDLTFQSNNATNLRTVRFVSQSATISPVSGIDVNCLYVVNGDLYYNDSLGDGPIQITFEGAVLASSSGISRVIGGITAEASFNASGVLVVNLNQATGEPANIQAQSILLGNASSSTNYTTVEAPASTPTQTLVLPTIPAVSTSLVTLDTSGNMTAAVVPDGSTISISGTTLEVPTGGISQSNLAIRGTGTTVGAGGVAISGSSFNFGSTHTVGFIDITNLSVTITTTGSPVWIGIQGQSTFGGEPPAQCNSISNTSEIQLLNGATQLAAFLILGTSSDVRPFTGFIYMDTPAAGTYTYKLQVQVGIGATFNMASSSLVAYEM